MAEHNITTGGELNRDSAEHGWEQFDFTYVYILVKLRLFAAAAAASCGFVILKPASLGKHIQH